MADWNNLSTIDTDTLLKQQKIRHFLSYIALSLAVFFLVGGIAMFVMLSKMSGAPTGLAFVVIVMGVLCGAFGLFYKSSSASQQEVAELASRGINVDREKSKGKKTGIIVVVSFIALIFILTLAANGNSGNSSKGSGSGGGYYDSNGYYHPSDDEMDSVWDEVYDWMDKNWD